MWGERRLNKQLYSIIIGAQAIVIEIEKKTMISPKIQDRSKVIDRECKRKKSENYLSHNSTHVSLCTLLYMHTYYTSSNDCIVQFREMLRQAEPRVHCTCTCSMHSCSQYDIHTHTCNIHDFHNERYHVLLIIIMPIQY